MLNTTQVKCPTVNSTTNNQLNINAVSGTICKNHPKSVFVWFKRGSELEKELLCAEPKYRFDFEKERYEAGGHYGLTESISRYVNQKEPCIVLQMMLTGEDRVIAEIVRESDFFETGGEA